MPTHIRASVTPASVRRCPTVAAASPVAAAVAHGLDATIVTRNRPDFERQGATVLTY